MKLSAENVWDGQFCSIFKIPEPQFSEQTKERLSSRGLQYCPNIAKDAFAFMVKPTCWRLQRRLAEMAIVQS